MDKNKAAYKLKGLPPIYYLNLDEQPERKQYMEEQFKYCDTSTNYTRIIEHKHFEDTKTEYTIITKEYPIPYQKNVIPYYPINDDVNQSLYKRYREKSKSLTNVIFGGRLSEYKYMDMHVIIESVMNKFIKEK